MNLTRIAEPSLKVAKLGPDELAEVLPVLKPLKARIKEIEDHTKALLKSGTEIPGVRLQPGAYVDTITDCVTVIRRLMALGYKQEDLIPYLSISKTAVRVLLAARLCKHGAALKEDLDKILDGCVETEQNAPSLKIQ